MGLNKCQNLPFVILGLPYGDSIRTFLPLGPKVTATAFASISTPASSDCLPSTPNFNSCVKKFPCLSCPSFAFNIIGLSKLMQLTCPLNKYKSTYLMRVCPRLLTAWQGTWSKSQGPHIREGGTSPGSGRKCSLHVQLQLKRYWLLGK